MNQSAPWVSNIVITPKADGSLKMALDTCNVNKVIIPTNQSIQRHEDIKSKLTVHVSRKWILNQPFGKLS